MWKRFNGMKIFFLALFSVCVIHVSSQTEFRDGKNYTAVVAEYSSAAETEENISLYEGLIFCSHHFYSSDIVVFPENTLTVSVKDCTLVPDPQDNLIPHENDTFDENNPIRRISAAAATWKVYIVVNVFERVNCTKETSDCPQKGYFVYNTNVVFDRKGAVIGRYRKFNVYDEKGVDKPDKPDFTTFTTDFGVTFGVFTCFDILFKTPAIDLVTERNIKHIIFPSRWIGELPFLTALQIQDGWSYSMNVSLYASGANEPDIGTTGSGIYECRKKKIASMYEKKQISLIHFQSLREDPLNDYFRKIHDKRISDGNDSLKLLEDPSIPMCRSKELDLNAGKFEDEITHNGLRCKFSLKYKKANVSSDVYTYKAVAFQGERRFGANFNHEVAYCAIVLCTNGNCAKKPEDGRYPLIFNSIKIDADFEKKNTFQMPNTLLWENKNDLELFSTMPYDYYSYETKNSCNYNMTSVSIELKKENIGNIITFGIFGRKFK